ncbi:MAG: SdrD B-like domain-containing protein [Patescibacteria group bacterium]
MSTLLGLLLVIVGTVALLKLNNTSLVSRADNSVVYSSGQVSIEKKYYNGVEEVDSLSINTGSLVTVRLKYNNTGASSAEGVSISDSLPVGFSLVSGSITNCFTDLDCVSLDDNLFDGGSLAVAPLAGYYSYAKDNTLASSNLEFGQKKYFKIVRCQDSNGLGDWYIPYASDGAGGTLGLSNSPLAVTIAQMQAVDTNYCSESGSTFLSEVFLARGNQYMHQVRCSSGSPTAYFGDWKIPTNQNPQAISLGLNNYSAVLNQSDIQYETPNYCTTSGDTFESMVINTSNRRYVHQVRCQDLIYFGDMYIPSNPDGSGGTLGVSNDPTNLTLAQMQVSEPQFCNDSSQTFESNVQDRLDTNNGYGYIQYQMTSPTTGGLFGTDVSMSGSFDADPISDPAPFSLSVGTDLVCPYMFPASGIRNITLGDAELRTDQDFTCNYIAKICVEVFQDDNANGIQDGGESRLAGVDIKLLTQDGQSEIYTLATDANGEQCFEPLLNSTIYKVQVVNPPSPYSTTGGDEQDVGVTYQTGSQQVKFGYSLGSLSLTAEETVSLGSIEISPNPQTVCTVINDIQVVDTRIGKPGWTVTATIDNFQDINDSAKIISVANAVELAPQTVTVVSGDSIGISPGQTKTVTSTVDPVSVMSSASGNGQGTFNTKMNLCLVVPAFTTQGQYYTTVNFVV